MGRETARLVGLPRCHCPALAMEVSELGQCGVACVAPLPDENLPECAADGVPRESRSLSLYRRHKTIVVGRRAFPFYGPGDDDISTTRRTRKRRAGADPTRPEGLVPFGRPWRQAMSSTSIWHWLCDRLSTAAERLDSDRRPWAPHRFDGIQD